ncbi:tRNA (adenosine(37)-N6)-threonylcarbamoyltransferase complex dimerization subunit type 1 TsaB [Sediminicurvatus halobius]|uniref:tRNA threonylcarbamoyladenosine biosynthesis protein TsaB n=1 Tax=Sediminicurvatus halobius TaxID=2182432 RepID=A0A2U2N5J3_9GAMM|nr:tRNA (adenosine(37)-N6)-threonylcarbamoyltransferase complex dimerization subunit type 1 TsaB [Spiribacter halobius]PWG64337.1 tRNA (adenosine(37)-N6)-threonylcarbamoyltransferase complex dimerization subunit type 1 TsaB [Spiribacter halobius]UEX79318.1 tRNA (adenosine(37)-N6)-threonylcarbamoyltransferase complex dimerization subunit type 1 TsaB [Spiribacter halobius]
MTGGAVLLALDATTEACSVALRVVGRDHGHWRHLPRGHSAALLPMLEALLAEAGVTRSAIDAIAFCAGPGAFTGVRIATGVAQGLGFALGRPVIPLSTLQVIAAGALRGGAGAPGVLVAADARMGEVYTAVYRATPEGPEAVVADSLAAPEAVAPPPGRWLGAGTGFAAHPEALAERLRPGLLAIEPQRLPDARDALGLAEVRLAAGEAVPAERAAPIYLRNRVATPRP